MRGLALVLAFLVGSFLGCLSDSGEHVEGSQYDNVFALPKLPPPARYGNVLISRLTAKSTHPPVAFSHWLHRKRYTCRVCHFELNFAMKTNATTDLNEERNRNGEFCGACHNGKIAFGHTEGNCRRCHTGNLGAADSRFSELNALPKARYGDQINWAKAVRRGLIAPKKSLFNDNYESPPFNAVLRLEPEWQMINTKALFSHETHTQWLDCADCHPDIFNIQKKGTRHFRMNYLVQGKFCGACHLTVAFPLQDCRRCHPDLN